MMIVLKLYKQFGWPGLNKIMFILFIYFASAYHLGIFVNAQTYNYSQKASSFKAKFMESSKFCSNIYNTTLLDILPLLVRSDIGSMQAKCFLLCLLKRYQMIDKGGTFQRDRVERFLDSMPDSKFKSSLKSFKDKCLKEDAQNQCQKAYKFSSCFYINGVEKKKEGRQNLTKDWKMQ